MRMVKYFLLAALTFVLVGLGGYQAEEKKNEKPKYTIKEVMKMAHGKDGLRNKVVDGTATKEEKEKLLELYTALSQNKPPKGDEKDWQERTGKLVKAAKDVVAGKAEGIKGLPQPADCMACHSMHRPEKK